VLAALSCSSEPSRPSSNSSNHKPTVVIRTAYILSVRARAASCGALPGSRLCLIVATNLHRLWQGTYFLVADIRPLANPSGDGQQNCGSVQNGGSSSGNDRSGPVETDVDFCQRLTVEAGVTLIPVRALWRELPLCSELHPLLHLGLPCVPFSSRFPSLRRAPNARALFQPHCTGYDCAPWTCSLQGEVPFAPLQAICSAHVQTPAHVDCSCAIHVDYVCRLTRRSAPSTAARTRRGTSYASAFASPWRSWRRRATRCRSTLASNDALGKS